MAFHTMTFSLTGGADRLFPTNKPVRQVILANALGNDPVLVGDSTLTASIYGFSIAANTSAPTLGPFSGEQPFSLSELYVKGTAAQILRVMYIT
jgi:hypothetical protein